MQYIAPYSGCTMGEYFRDRGQDALDAERQEEARDLARRFAVAGILTLPVLIEGQGQGVSVGRSFRDAPEIDGLVIVEGAAPVGEIVPVTITGAMVYDLSGKLSQRSPVLAR